MVKTKMVRLSTRGNEFNIKTGKSIITDMFQSVKSEVARKYWLAGSYTIRFESKDGEIYVNAYGNNSIVSARISNFTVDKDSIVITCKDGKRYKVISTNNTHSSIDEIKSEIKQVVASAKKANILDFANDIISGVTP